MDQTIATYDHIATRYWVVDREGHERFFSFYQPDELDSLIREAGIEIATGWINPPGEGQP